MLLGVVSTTAWALSEENGFYQIGSAEDYAEFAALVNGGQRSANAILTADIDLGTDIDSYKIYNGEYQGVFDGAGHTVTINFSDGTKDNQGPALFRSIGLVRNDANLAIVDLETYNVADATYVLNIMADQQ